MLVWLGARLSDRRFFLIEYLSKVANGIPLAADLPERKVASHLGLRVAPIMTSQWSQGSTGLAGSVGNDPSRHTLPPGALVVARGRGAPYIAESPLQQSPSVSFRDAWPATPERLRGIPCIGHFHCRSR